jgi:epoxyqueuosine reductase
MEIMKNNNSEKILLHICCAPCAIYPLKVLQKKGYDITGFFYNSNIHPYTEYQKRLEALEQLEKQESLSIEYIKDYNIESYLRAVSYNEHRRCPTCYYLRLFETGKMARKLGFDVFTTTLLYSVYQQHDMIKEIGNKIAKQLKLKFYYDDFRKGWAEGVKVSKEKNLYRQKYCGCIYSERDRFFKKNSNYAIDETE